MKSAHYDVSDRDGNRKHYLVTYDETAPCVLCGLPVNSASISATALCGPCDMGKERPGRPKAEWRCGDPKPSVSEVWSNAKDHFYFDTREECDGKMYELHQQGIEGWPHVVERQAQLRSK